jgi:hypothetical protein
LSPSFVHVFPCEHSLLKYDPWLIPAFTDDSSVVDMVNRLFPSLVYPVPIPSHLFSFSVTCSAWVYLWLVWCIYLYSFSEKTPSGLSCFQKAPFAHPFVNKAHLHIYFLHLIPDRLGHVCLTGRMSLQLKISRTIDTVCLSFAVIFLRNYMISLRIYQRSICSSFTKAISSKVLESYRSFT